MQASIKFTPYATFNHDVFNHKPDADAEDDSE
jgi:hypothetical protein